MFTETNITKQLKGTMSKRMDDEKRRREGEQIPHSTQSTQEINDDFVRHTSIFAVSSQFNSESVFVELLRADLASTHQFETQVGESETFEFDGALPRNQQAEPILFDRRIEQLRQNGPVVLIDLGALSRSLPFPDMDARQWTILGEAVDAYEPSTQSPFPVIVIDHYSSDDENRSYGTLPRFVDDLIRLSKKTPNGIALAIDTGTIIDLPTEHYLPVAADLLYIVNKRKDPNREESFNGSVIALISKEHLKLGLYISRWFSQLESRSEGLHDDSIEKLTGVVYEALKDQNSGFRAIISDYGSGKTHMLRRLKERMDKFPNKPCGFIEGVLPLSEQIDQVGRLVTFVDEAIAMSPKDLEEIRQSSPNGIVVLFYPNIDAMKMHDEYLAQQHHTVHVNPS